MFGTAFLVRLHAHTPTAYMFTHRSNDFKGKSDALLRRMMSVFLPFTHAFHVLRQTDPWIT